MFRAIVCTLALAAGPVARAGELDRETAVAGTSPAVAVTIGGSELDRESPQPAHGWRWGVPFHAPWGWGGFFPARVSFFGFGFSPFYSFHSFRSFGFYPGFYRPFGFYPGFHGGFGFGSPFFPTFYSPFGFRYWW